MLYFVLSITSSLLYYTCERQRYLYRHGQCFIGTPSCSKTPMMNQPTCLMNLYLRLPVSCHSVYSKAAKEGRRGDPFVPRWDTLSNTPMLNKHSQASSQLTPATGIPLVCLDDGGLLLSFASALGWEANGTPGYSSMLHIDSPTLIKLYLLVLNKKRKGDLQTLSQNCTWLTRERGRKKRRKKLECCSACVSSPAKPMRESVSASTTVKRIPASAAAAAISAARYTNQECVFLQMIKSIPFWQDLLEHASLFYAIPSLSSGSIYQPAEALSPNGDCSLACTW